MNTHMHLWILTWQRQPQKTQGDTVVQAHVRAQYAVCTLQSEAGKAAIRAEHQAQDGAVVLRVLEALEHADLHPTTTICIAALLRSMVPRLSTVLPECHSTIPPMKEENIATPNTWRAVFRDENILTRWVKGH